MKRDIMKGNLVVKNVVFGFGTKIILMGLNIVIPRLFIVSYGSEVNGLLATIAQIFSYLALLEAGIGGATVNAMYKPLDQNDWSQANRVFNEAKAYYRKVTKYYICGIVIFAGAYPFVSTTTVEEEIVFAVIALQGGASCISYWFCAAYDQLLIADGKNYLLDNVAFIISLGTAIAKILLVSLGFGVVIVQISFFFISVVKIPIVYAVCYRRYPWLSPQKTKQYELIRDRSAFLIHEISGTIFSSTDILIVSTFCGFKLASVYSVYNLVFGALNTMINTANAGLGFVLGQNYYKDRCRFLRIYDCYSTLYSMIVFAVMTIAYVLIEPFIQLYTHDVTDINYTVKWLPILFAVINLMSGSRAIAARLITVTGHARQTQSHSMMEAIINIVASIILVQYFSIYGVLLGTIVALLYRMNDIIIYANKVILGRTPWREYQRVIINAGVFTLIAVGARNIEIVADNYLELLGIALMVSILIVLIYGSVTFLTNRKLLMDALRMYQNLREKL